ncbi:MAG: dihydroorotase [Opitutales bacterium]|nr:dihydroorotase [Opitutales bacterium]
MANILEIKNAHIIDPANQRDEKNASLFIVDGTIVEGLDEAQKKLAETIDVGGAVVCPGFVDLNAHLYQPGKTVRETIASGSKAAAHGGVTTVVCTPDEGTVVDNAGTVRLIKELCDKDACVRIVPVGNITLGGKGEALAPTGALKKAGCVALSDSIGGVSNNEIMRRALEYSLLFDIPIFDHCQDSSMSKTGVMHEGEESLHLGLRGMPRASEDIVVGADTLLSRLTEARLHIQHVSSFRAVETIQNAKKHNVRISAEVSPAHLLLTDKDVGDYDCNKKINPPLRNEKDRLALIDGLKSGAINAIASDHSPRTPTEKDCEFDYAPFGVTGLETLLPASLEALYHSGKMSLSEVIGKLTCGPAAVIKSAAGTLSAGTPADITVFDPDAPQTWTADKFLSKAKNSPFLGRSLRGKILMTFVAGTPVYQAND